MKKNGDAVGDNPASLASADDLGMLRCRRKGGEDFRTADFREV
jgi:hypothetical protein